MVTKREQKLIATSNMLDLLIKLGINKSVINYVYARIASEKMMLSVERMMADIEQNMYAFPNNLGRGDHEDADQSPGFLSGLQKWLRNL